MTGRACTFATRKGEPIHGARRPLSIGVAACVALFGCILTGCSNKDFARGPLTKLMDMGDSGKPFIEDKQEIEKHARQREERLKRALAEWAQTKQETGGEYRIGPEDTLEIVIVSLEEPGQAKTLSRDVGDDGTVVLPFVGALKVGGSTTRDAEQAGRAAYSDRYIRDPQISVNVTRYRSAAVVVTGAVKTPGMYYLKRNTSTILEILLKSGGLTTDAGPELYLMRNETTAGETGIVSSAEAPASAPPAQTSAVERAENVVRPALEMDMPRSLPPERGSVQRPGNAENAAAERARELQAEDGPVTGLVNVAEADLGAANKNLIPIDLKRLIDEGDLRLNLVVRRGDILSVPEREKEYIYVLGYVNGPGRVQIDKDRQVTAMSALAMVGGLSSQSRAEKSYLIREAEGGMKKIYPVDLLKIANGIRPDVNLRAGDTLVVGAGLLMKMTEIFHVGGSAAYSVAPVP